MSRAAPDGSKSRPVLLYVGIMFVLAMLLLVLSFLMQQRNHEALMDSMEGVQTVIDLEIQIADMEEQLADAAAEQQTLSAALESAEKANETLTAERLALGHLLELQYVYDNGTKDEAKVLFDAYTAAAYNAFLPAEPFTEGAKSPLALYEALVLAFAS